VNFSLVSCRGARDADADRVQNNQLNHEANRRLNEVLCVFTPNPWSEKLANSLCSFFTRRSHGRGFVVLYLFPTAHFKEDGGNVKLNSFSTFLKMNCKNKIFTCSKPNNLSALVQI
jgi:hypothetical protein